MKKSYKLIGKFWDRREIYQGEIKVMLKDDVEPDNLFAVTKIMGTEYPEKMKGEIEGGQILFLDYLPSAKSNIINCYFFKRVLQISEYYHVSAICCEEERQVSLVKQKLIDVSERKTPNQLLAQLDGVLQMIC